MTRQRDEYTAKMKTQLDELNARIDVIQANAHTAREDAREAYQAELKKVREQSRLALAKLAEVRLAGEDAWDKMVLEMDKVTDAFAHSFHYFKAQF